MRIEYERPFLYPKQLKALFCKERYSFIEASTKAGKTHAGIAWLVEQALIHGKEGREYWWVAPVYPQAKIAYRRCKRAIPSELRTANESELYIQLPNGARIVFKSGEKPDNLYGEDVYSAIIDEASRLREESFHAVRSTLTQTRGKVRCIGNVKGKKNWFYLLSRKAQSNEPDMAYHKITAYDAVEAGILASEEIEDAKRTLPENVFRELYLAEPSDDGGNPFGIDSIRACRSHKSTLPVSCWGIDLAKSVDWTVLHGLDVNGNTAGFHRFQKPWNETVDYIKRIVGNTPALVDSTGVGDPILEQLQRDCRRAVGFKFTSPSKQALMEGLAVAIQSCGLTYHDDVIMNELEVFEYEYTKNGVKYSAPSGMHDDCVMALALAYKKLKEATGRRYRIS